jgi:hypothetical protein
MDLDAILDEAAADLKPEASAAPKKKVDPPEIRPYLAAAALAPPELRDKWNGYVRRDIHAVAPSKFLASQAYQRGDPYAPQSLNKMLYDLIRTAAYKSQIDESKMTRLLQLVNPNTDSEAGKRIQAAFKRHLLKSVKNDIVNDINYDPSKFPHLSAELAQD